MLLIACRAARNAGVLAGWLPAARRRLAAVFALALSATAHQPDLPMEQTKKNIEVLRSPVPR